MSGKSRVLGSVLFASAMLGGGAALAQQSGAPPSDPVHRGEYLARAADCVACHTTPGGKPYAGGLGIALPFGTIYSPNITPDKETGIGDWSDDDFVRAVQQGIAKDGTHLYPAFPYASYALMSRDDVLAIKAYLFSLPPVSNKNQPSELKFPFNQRWAMIGWNMLFLPSKPLANDDTKPPQWNRGRYLVDALGHCGECHTPRGTFEQVDDSQKFAGTVQQGWKAYNITADKQSGLGGWSDDALRSYLKSGYAPDHSSAGGPMGEVVANSLRYLNDQDIDSMVAYLRTIAPIQNAPAVQAQPAALKSPPNMADLGARVFAGECANCHAWDGTGVQTPQASLLGSRTVNDPEGTNLVQAVLRGVHYQTNKGDVYMPPFAKGRSTEELAAVVNFVSARFGNGALHLTADDVRQRIGPTSQPVGVPGWIMWAVGVVALVIIALIIWGLTALFRRPHRTRAAE